MLFLTPGILLSWYFYIFLSTEIFSYFEIINIYNLFLSQIIFICGLIFYLGKKINKFNLPKIKLWQFPVIALPILTFIQGFFSAPATTDSMVYHLPRIMYWLQDQTVAQSYIRNSHDFMAPFAEYIVLHLYSFTNSDRLAFLSQWIAYIASTLIVLCIAKKYLNIKKLWPVAAFTLTLPITLFQSSSTQTDMVTTIFILLSIYYAFEFKAAPSLRNALMVGAALGLGMLTKATFALFALIPASILLLSFVNNYKLFYKFFGYGLLILLIFLLIQIRFLNQNLNLYGNFSGQSILEEGSSYSNESLGFNILLSNLIRNSFLQIPIPVFNTQLNSGLENELSLINISLNDPKTTYPNTSFKILPVIYPQEDIVSNPIHFFIILAALFLFILNFKKINSFNLSLLFSLSWVTFIIFCLILKWQPFHSRLQIPFLLIGSVTGLIILDRFKLVKIIRSSIIISTFLAFILIILNVSKPFLSYSTFYELVSKYSPDYASVPEAFYLKPRVSQYFNPRYYWQKPYSKVIENTQPDDKIHFKLMDEYEYPFWTLLQNKNLKFKVVDSKNANVIISTSQQEMNLEGYSSQCFKSDIDYGYACILRKN